MTDSGEGPLARAASEFLPDVLKAALTVVAPMFAPPDLREATINALLEDMTRLYRLMHEMSARLSAEVVGKMSPVETLELAVQTVANMERTAMSERRALMANVLVNGLSDPTTSALERRVFVRLIGNLDLPHVELLRVYEADHGTGRRHQQNDVHQAVVTELIGLGLIRRETAATADGHVGILREEITELGRRFLAHLCEPGDNDGK
jgi:hypothetical protein